MKRIYFFDLIRMSIVDDFSSIQLVLSLPWSVGCGWNPPATRNLHLGTISVAGAYVSAGLLSNLLLDIEYVFDSAQDLTFLQSLTFDNCSSLVDLSLNLPTFSLLINGASIATTTVDLNPTSQPVTISTPGGGGTGVTSLRVQVSTPLAVAAVITLGSLSSLALCVARGSKISTPQGLLAIEHMQRGQEVIGQEDRIYRVARVIEQKINPEQEVEVIEFPPSSLEPGLPREKTLVCSEHYLLYQNKRRLAKCFLPYPAVKKQRGLARDILPPDEEGHFYLYDLQFEEEGSYLVNGLLSQSRSPYARISPLPKELYFQPEKYRHVLVDNTLTEDPPISFNYLLMNGQEVEAFLGWKAKEK